MTQFLWRGLLRSGFIIFLICHGQEALGKHILGGSFSLTPTSNATGIYRLTLKLYVDELAVQSTDTYETELYAYIFRKRDHARMRAVTLTQVYRNALPFDNQACAELRKLKVAEVQYDNTLEILPERFNDPEGYYVVWERCCRSGAVDNIQRSLDTGLAIYMEFPAASVNKQPFTNASPEFDRPNGDYICVGKPFQMSFKAVDPDSDELRYSLVTPLAGHTTSASPGGSGQSFTSYPEIQWAGGYSLQSVIPGQPALRINPDNGRITVIASQVGLYVFTVQCEEYRAGRRIGLVRMDFQLPVVECSRQTPPVPVIAEARQPDLPISEVTLCQGASLTLITSDNPDWTFQWQRNGENIPKATAARYELTEPGDYQVVKSFAKTCANDTISSIVRVRPGFPLKITILPGKQASLCEGDSLLIDLIGESGLVYTWQKGGIDFRTTEKKYLWVHQEGIYTVAVQGKLGQCPYRDTVEIKSLKRPTGLIESFPASLCEGDSVRLTWIGTDADSLIWYYQNQRLTIGNTLITRQEGEYYLIAKTSNGCQQVSENVSLVSHPKLEISWEPIPSLCLNAEPIQLIATPEKGVYQGTGISRNQFNPQLAGPGNHQIQYTIISPYGCKTVSTQEIEVYQLPALKVPDPITLRWGDSTTVDLQPDSTIRSIRWSPPVDLPFQNATQVTLQPDVSTTYTITATSSLGCTVLSNFTITITNQLFWPNSFTPNGDGINDAWRIVNIEGFPTCEIWIYNRWGEPVFYSKGYSQPWDGTYRQLPVSPGLYSFRIKTHQATLEYHGVVEVIR